MSAPTPSLSVVIPGYNRAEPLKYTLRSVARAAGVLEAPVETILVDDGSEPTLQVQLGAFDPGIAVTHLRQINQGSIVARLSGLATAKSDYVLFLDSDDLVHPQKFRQQLETMRTGSVDVSYSDMARATLGPDYTATDYAPADVLDNATEPADLYLRVQPAPHGPIYRRDYLLTALAAPIVPPVREMDAVGDVWLYYNLAPHPARIVKVPAPLTATGPHDEDRYSRHWEKLGCAALLVAESFVARCPVTPATLAARVQAGECAFNSWRRLPRNFNRGYERRTLEVWRRSARGPLARLGGPLFQAIARIFGPAGAGHLLRLRNAPYSRVRSLDQEAYNRLFADAA